jgi:hypothetical protein
MQDGSNDSKRIGAVMDFETVIPIESKPKVYSKFSDKDTKEQILQSLQEEGRLHIIKVGEDE